VIISNKAAAKCDKINAQFAGNIYASFDQVDPSLSTRRFDAHERWFVRAGGGKEMRCSCHTGWLDMRHCKPFFDCSKIFIADLERIELIAMEGNFDARVARLVDGIDCVQEAQLRQAKGTVTQLCHCRSSPNWEPDACLAATNI
jgi:hypothetical protein